MTSTESYAWRARRVRVAQVTRMRQQSYAYQIHVQTHTHFVGFGPNTPVHPGCSHSHLHYAAHNWNLTFRRSTTPSVDIFATLI